MWTKLSRMWVRKPGAATAAPGRASRAARRFVPRLERLDDRLVPATILVTTRLDVVNPADGLVSLREAITTANATPAPDLIRLQAGTYRMTLAGAGDNANAAGDFDITSPVTIAGLGPTSTVVDAGRLDRVFHVRGTAALPIKATFQGLAIRNGRSTDGGGGGILIGNADLVVDNSAITGNQGFPGGGGISNFGSAGTGNVTVSRSTVSRNLASAGNGGGIDLAGSTLTLTGSRVERNVTGEPGADTGGGFGGGFYAQNAAVTGGVIAGNTAYQSGGGFYATNSATLTKGTVAGNSARLEGGGMYVFNTATLTGTAVRGNTAFSPVGFGGGLVTTNALLTSATVSGNTAGRGAGVAATFVSLTGTRVAGNTAEADGGGVYSITTANLVNSTVSGNFAGNGGGGVFAATVNLTGSTVDDNSARTFGGGIAAPTTNLTNSTVSGNVAGGNGGGINATTVRLTNATVSGNSAGANGLGAGGGVFASHGTILNSTIVENFAGNGGGGVRSAGTSDPIHLKNTIVALNQVLAISSGPDVSGTVVSDGNNLIGDVSGSTGFGAVGDQLGAFGAELDPHLGPLQLNGGRTMTHAPLKGSRAIDRGNNAGVPSTDQRGVARIRDGDGNTTSVVDIGAVER